MTRFLLLSTLSLFLSACLPTMGETAAGAVSVGATAAPALVATAQADQYWRDAQATTQAYNRIVEANYRQIQGTAQAATSTVQAQQTSDTFSFSLTADAATVQAQETRTAATANAQYIATAQAHKDAVATSTAAAGATASAFQATRQSFALAQAQALARREHITTVVAAILAYLIAGLLAALVIWFFFCLTLLVACVTNGFLYKQNRFLSQGKKKATKHAPPVAKGRIDRSGLYPAI